MDRIRCSNITQLACAPYKLLRGLECVEYQEHSPTENAALLASGKLDAALIPIVEYLQIENHQQEELLALDFGMGTRQRTDSMMLYSDTAPKDLKRVYVYQCSSSSTTLLRLLLGEKWRVFPEIVKIDSLDLDLPLRNGDGMLSLHELPGSIRRDYLVAHDLGTLWYRHTKTPFVFLIWAVRKSLVGTTEFGLFNKELFRIAQVSRQLHEQYANWYNVDTQEIAEFVGENRRFYLDAFLKDGLKEVVNRGLSAGLIDDQGVNGLVKSNASKKLFSDVHGLSQFGKVDE